MNITLFRQDNRKLPPGNTATMDIIYKIVSEDEWRRATQSGVYFGSDDDRRDGFIHLSAGHQLAGTAAKHFSGKPGLVLVAFAASALGPKLKWEVSRGGDRFPHLYDGLPAALALWTKPLPLGQDGVPQLPAEL